MAYTRTTWRTGETPLSAGNMNNIEDGIEEALAIVQSIAEVVYPVGCYFETSDTEFDPNVTFGGTWILEAAGLVHVSAGAGYAVNGANTNTKDGGSKDAIVPYHNHGFTQPTISSNTSGYYILGAVQQLSWKSAASGNAVTRLATSPGAITRDGAKATGGAVHYAGTSGNVTNANMQPYIVVNRWHRTA